MTNSAGASPSLLMSTAVTDSDHGIVVTVVAWLCLAASVIFLGARIHIRWPLGELFGRDDAACTVSMVRRRNGSPLK